MSFGKQWHCCPVLLSVAAAGIFTFAQKYNQNLFKGFDSKLESILQNGFKNIFCYLKQCPTIYDPSL